MRVAPGSVGVFLAPPDPQSGGAPKPIPAGTVRAKLYVSGIGRDVNAPDSINVHLAAVTRGDDNKTWAEASPSAEFRMTINNPSAAAFFVLGQELYVTFERAEVKPLLSDGHAFEPVGDQEWSKTRCKLCGCRKASHEEPLRTAIVAAMKI